MEITGFELLVAVMFILGVAWWIIDTYLFFRPHKAFIRNTNENCALCVHLKHGKCRVFGYERNTEWDNVCVLFEHFIVKGNKS
jgi:hypothetical protein